MPLNVRRDPGKNFSGYLFRSPALIKKLSMKKLMSMFAMAVLVTAFYACGSGDDHKNEENKDSVAATTTEPMPAETPAMDTAAAPAATTATEEHSH
jgi:hypothetical protein